MDEWVAQFLRLESWFNQKAVMKQENSVVKSGDRWCEQMREQKRRMVWQADATDKGRTGQITENIENVNPMFPQSSLAQVFTFALWVDSHEAVLPGKT